MLEKDVQEFLLQQAKERFLRYVQINTTSDEDSGIHPSSEGQLRLADLLSAELQALGLQEVEADAFGYVYAILPASPGVSTPPLTFCAHLDTSPAESGEAVKPVIHPRYDGGIIRFADDPALELSVQDSPALQEFIGENIITASGKTLLGADDKAGVAEIMAALAALQKYPSLPHPELRIVFTPDEEIGEGTLNIRLEKLGKVAYTLDGGQMGELEDECFNAVKVRLVFHGINVHPGEAKDRMVNAAAIAARFAAALPEHETPEHTQEREGFYHLMDIRGSENEAELRLILRDFDKNGNTARLNYIRQLLGAFETRYPALRVDVQVSEQYHNMKTVLDQHPEITQKAARAIRAAGVKVLHKAIRGGTDGTKLTFRGLPTPNLFTGGVLFHSRKEWVPEIALQKAAETILYLCQFWTEGE